MVRILGVLIFMVNYTGLKYIAMINIQYLMHTFLSVLFFPENSLY